MTLSQFMDDFSIMFNQIMLLLGQFTLWICSQPVFMMLISISITYSVVKLFLILFIPANDYVRRRR